jgi:Family of unknown function (DUF5647)
LAQDPMSREEQGARNVELVGRYLEHLLDHPEEIEALDGAEIVLIPDNDSELASANRVLAEQLRAQHPDTRPAPTVQVKSA